MAQVKKIEVRDAILESAFDLFVSKGYAHTTLAEIATGAQVATSNIYVYFDSKLDVLFAIFGPWLHRQLDRLQAQLADAPDPRGRLRLILFAVWRDIPVADSGFSHNLMQAISNLGPEEEYSRELLFECEARVSGMIADCLPPERAAIVDDRHLLAHLAIMAQDGFTINFKLNGPSRRLDAIVGMMCDLLLGPEPAP